MCMYHISVLIDRAWNPTVLSDLCNMAIRLDEFPKGGGGVRKKKFFLQRYGSGRGWGGVGEK